MANRFWSVNPGQDKTKVAETATTTGAALVEVRVTYDDAVVRNNKVAAMTALRQILSRIEEDTWPPA